MRHGYAPRRGHGTAKAPVEPPKGGQSLRRCLVIATDSPVGGLDSIGSYIISKTSRQAQGKRSVPNPPSLRRNEAYYFFQHSDTNAPTKKKLLRRTLASEELLFCSRGLLKLHSSLVPPLSEALGELAVHLIDELTN